MPYYVLGVPATSAHVERVFSHGGQIIRSHQVCMSDGTLAQIVFPPCY